MSLWGLIDVALLKYQACSRETPPVFRRSFSGVLFITVRPQHVQAGLNDERGAREIDGVPFI